MGGFVAHLDADCFYVSAERVRPPDLMGKPVGVLGNNGACVIAKSYEMKAKGVKTGTTIWDAQALCPEGVYVKRDFYWYEVLSRKMLDIVGTFSPRVEYYSIDEFFFRAEPLARGQQFTKTAQAIRDHIREHAGLPVTLRIGLGDRQPTAALGRLAVELPRLRGQPARRLLHPLLVGRVRVVRAEGAAGVRGPPGVGIDIHDTTTGRRQPPSLAPEDRAGPSIVLARQPVELFFAPDARTFAMTKGDGGRCRELADICLVVPGTSTYPGQTGKNDNNFHFEDMVLSVNHILVGLLKDRVASAAAAAVG